MELNMADGGSKRFQLDARGSMGLESQWEWTQGDVLLLFALYFKDLISW